MSMIGRFMPSWREFWYSSGGSDQRYLLRTYGTLSDVAVEAAEDFHSHHDGWEARWPREFVLYDSEDGEPIARFEVERDTEPVFHAHQLAPADGQA